MFKKLFLLILLCISLTGCDFIPLSTYENLTDSIIFESMVVNRKQTIFIGINNVTNTSCTIRCNSVRISGYKSGLSFSSNTEDGSIIVNKDETKVLKITVEDDKINNSAISNNNDCVKLVCDYTVNGNLVSKLVDVGVNTIKEREYRESLELGRRRRFIVPYIGK